MRRNSHGTQTKIDKIKPSLPRKRIWLSKTVDWRQRKTTDEPIRTRPIKTNSQTDESSSIGKASKAVVDLMLKARATHRLTVLRMTLPPQNYSMKKISLVGGWRQLTKELWTPMWRRIPAKVRTKTVDKWLTECIQDVNQQMSKAKDHDDEVDKTESSC